MIEQASETSIVICTFVHDVHAPENSTRSNIKNSERDRLEASNPKMIHKLFKLSFTPCSKKGM